MNFNKKIKLMFSTILVIILLLMSSTSNIVMAKEEFNINAKSALLMDASTGEILYEKNIHEKLPPASITKIMTLLLAMEALDSNKISLNDQVQISEKASGMGGSQIYLEPGEIQTVENLIKAICLRSANDASVALGEHIAGSYDLFVKMMNDKAKELGMTNTNFMNSTGLPTEGHYTSAYDIALMSKELLKHEKIHQWLTLWITNIKVGKNNDIVQTLVNTNRLIHDYNGANGIKTGYTSEAGYCLSASAQRGNLKLISVILGCESSSIRFSESKKLLDYGFANYDSLPLYKKGDFIKKVKLKKGLSEDVNVIIENSVNLLIKKGSSKSVEKEINLPEYIEAPISKNQKVGEIIFKIDNKEVARANLIAEKDVEKAGFFDMLKKMIRNMLIFDK